MTGHTVATITITAAMTWWAPNAPTERNGQ